VPRGSATLKTKLPKKLSYLAIFKKSQNAVSHKKVQYENEVGRGWDVYKIDPFGSQLPGRNPGFYAVTTSWKILPYRYPV